MKKCAFVIYRRWAFEIFQDTYELSKKTSNFTIDTLITIDLPEFDMKKIPSDVKTYTVKEEDNKKIYEILKEQNVEIAFFYSWSWIIKEPLIGDFMCLALHPSPLPKFRGGSPIQNQILEGKRHTCLTLFKIESGIDSGPIYLQTSLSLKGDIKDIFRRMKQMGTQLNRQFINDWVIDKVSLKTQKNVDNYPSRKRRLPLQSQLSFKEISTMTYNQFYNIIRSLTDPYPNAFIIIGDKKLYITKVKKVTRFLTRTVILNRDSGDIPLKRPLYVKIKDGYAQIRRYTITLL